MKTIAECVKESSQNNTIVPGFNVFGYEDALAIVRGAERAHSPVLLMVNRDARATMEVEHWAALLGSIAKNANVPVGIHLDHCTEKELVKRSIKAGYTSVMYDGSKLPLEENIRNTKEMVQLADFMGVSVEGEIGMVPYEDEGGEAQVTSPYEANVLWEESGLDWLAVSVGNVHRLTDRKVPIDFKVLAEIEQVCHAPLVIHGASGLYEADILKLKATKVGKMNIGTALRKVFGDSLRTEIMNNPMAFDRLVLMKQPNLEVEEKAYEIISMLSR